MDDNPNTPPELANAAAPRRPGQERAPYFNFFLLSADALCIADPFGCFKQVNPAFTRLTGYSESELLSKPFLEFVHPEDRQRTAEEMALQVALRSSLDFENRYIRKDGSVVHLSWTAHFDKTDGVTYASARDITDRKLADDALQKALRLLDESQAMSHLGGWEYDVASERISWTNEVYRIYGVSPDYDPSDVGADVGFYAPEHAPLIEQAFRRAVELGEPYDLELEFVRADGQQIWVQTFGRPVIENGQVVRVTGGIGDITSRKRVEEELAENRGLLRAVIEGTTDAVFVKDLAGRYILANTAAARAVGKPVDEILGQDDYALFPAAEAKAVMEGDRQTIALGAPRNYEEVITTAGGQPRTYLAMKGPLFDPNGQATGLFGVSRDITDRKRAEDAIHESEARFQLLFDRASDGIALLSLDGELLSVNESFARMHGYSREDMLHRNVKDLDTPRSFRSVPERMRRVLAGEAVTFEAEHIHRDGHVFPLEVSVSLISSAGKSVIQGFHRDITARKRAEDAIHESEARFRAVVDTVPAAIWIYNGERWVFANEAASLITGYSHEEILAPGWLQRSLHPEDAASVIERAASRLRGESVETRYECRIVRRDGDARWFQNDAVPITFAGRPATLVISTDVTERKQAEEARRKLDFQVREAQKLESLGVLAGGIAHDFNNLLTAVLGNASLALMDLPPGSAARESIEGIEEAAGRAAALTAQMLAYSGRGHFIIEPLNLALLVQEMAPLFAIAISPQSVLEYRCAPNTPLIAADAAQMRQMVMGLVTNASEAIGDAGGFIEISTGLRAADRAYLSETYLDNDLPEGDYAFLEIADTGCGMDDATRLRIFEPFFTTKFAGRGLGLAAVLGIVRSHGGAIKVASEVGRGTTFTVLFPVSETSTPAAPATATAPRTPTILVVDDDATVRTITSRVLGQSGYTAMTVSNGMDALALFQQQAPFPDLVLLDMSMPGMDGRATYRELRRIDPTVRVVLMSGFDQADAAEQFQGEDLAGFIQKPFLADDLLAALANALA